MPTNGFDYDVIVLGCGSGGSVTALRATERGCRVGVMESGRRWPDSAIPTSNWDITKYVWQPELEMYGIRGKSPSAGRESGESRLTCLHGPYGFADEVNR